MKETNGDRSSHHFLKDEQGDWSVARVLIVFHTLQIWTWTNTILVGWLTPPDSAVLDMLIAMNVFIYGVLGSWAAGPRVARYILTATGQAMQGIAALGGRRAGTDNSSIDDERGPPA